MPTSIYIEHGGAATGEVPNRLVRSFTRNTTRPPRVIGWARSFEPKAPLPPGKQASVQRIQSPDLDRRRLLIETVRAATDLIATDVVARKWESPSVLTEMTVGAVAVHLVNATCQNTIGYLDTEPPPGDLAMSAHRLIAGVPVGFNAEVHRQVRSVAVDQASMGPAVAATWGADAVAELELRLRQAPPDRRVRVMAGIDMQLDEFVITRLVEAAIHLDDLASSVGAETRLSEAAATVVIDCLVSVARQRNGDVEVMRAMARTDRAMAQALRVF